MSTTPLPRAGDRLPEMHVSVAGDSFAWTSELVADGPTVWLVFEAFGALAGARARAFDALADALEHRGVALIGLAAATPEECGTFQGAEELGRWRFVADPTAQVCGALGLMNGAGPRPCALVVGRDASVRALVTADALDDLAPATLEALEHAWPAPQLALA